MKLNHHLQSLFIRDSALQVRLAVDTELPVRQLHPRHPSVIAWTSQRMMRISLARPDLDTSPTESLHRSETYMSLLRPLGLQSSWHQTA